MLSVLKYIYSLFMGAAFVFALSVYCVAYLVRDFIKWVFYHGAIKRYIDKRWQIDETGG